ncbi:response regulator transcription factor [Paenibacillus nasutitermitis]|uniref:Two-component system, response regulator YesN n=1 Tax=Paenibacillus nasutitermitis TaxID=1652958 RepID=A0A916ZF83_9BACL|nr:response regulator [Paenibacillus nasutitermitis]GGD93801.1 hypothetical protein GCM10010911_60580 [Paenibacillus nasutitermitis]
MRKIMIVDDETLVRIGMQTIIDWEKEGYLLTGVYSSGEEALEAVHAHPPDVIMTDIRMKGMDGFALIDAVKKKYPRVQFIILSSYEDFEYTRQAIRKGVHDYIPKHRMEPADLLQILNSLTYKEETGPAVDPLLAEKEELLEKAGEPGCVLNAAHFPLLYNSLMAKGGEIRWIRMTCMSEDKTIGASVRKAFHALAAELLGRWKQVELLGIRGDALEGLAVYPEMGEEPPEELTGRLFNELDQNIREKLNLRTVLGASRRFALAGFQPLLARQEAEAASGRFFYDGSGVYRAEDAAAGTLTEEKRYALYKTAKQLIASDRFEAFNEAWFRRVKEEAGAQPTLSEWHGFADMMHTLLLDMLIDKYQLQEAAIQSHMERLQVSLAKIKGAQTFNGFGAGMMEMITGMKAVSAELQQERGWIRKISEWLESRYTGPVRLEDAAECVNFSTGYFSQRFHQETGMVFTDYVAQLRIRKAIDLMRTTGYSTEEIAHRVGFVNANYFVRVFKKVTGRTLSEFKNQAKEPES